MMVSPSTTRTTRATARDDEGDAPPAARSALLPNAPTATATASRITTRRKLIMGNVGARSDTSPPWGGKIRSMSSLQAPPGLQPSASYSFTMRIELRQLPGAFAQVAGAIGQQGAILGAIDLVRVDGKGVTRDVTVACADGGHAERVVAAVRALDGVKVVSVSDRT